MGLQAGSADMRPLSAGWDVYTGRYHGCHGAPKKQSYICLTQRSSLVFSFASHCAIISQWTGYLKSPYQSLLPGHSWRNYLKEFVLSSCRAASQPKHKSCSSNVGSRHLKCLVFFLIVNKSHGKTNNKLIPLIKSSQREPNLPYRRAQLLSY